MHVLRSAASLTSSSRSYLTFQAPAFQDLRATLRTVPRGLQSSASDQMASVPESVPSATSSTVAAAATIDNAATMDAKVVLACFGDHKRELNFSEASSAQLEVKNLKRAFLAAFSDVIESGVEEKNLVVQLKSEVWGGEFLDITDDQSIPNHSVVKVALTSTSASVSYVYLYI